LKSRLGAIKLFAHMVGEYLALFALAGVAGLGIPGPGDSALIAAALVAADGHLNLPLVLVLGFFGSLFGRIAGYVIGAKGGRSLLLAPGWFEGFRHGTVEKGDSLFQRFPKTAVLLVPSPISGIYRVPLVIFACASVAVCTSWTLTTGLGAYLLGEAAKDLLGDAGFKAVLVVAVLAVIGLGYRYAWRRLRSRKDLRAKELT
jgi:membrane protein DedA with SNARE-associated domain